MTEMPSGRPSEPRTGPAAPAPAHRDGPTRPSPPTGRTELRDRIAEALYRWTTEQTAGGPARLLTRDETVLWENSLARADAVLPVVQDAIAQYRMQVDDPDSLLTRLDQAERERAQARDAIADERRGRLAAEAAVRRVRALCSRGPGPANEYQIWTVDVLDALDAEQPKETR